MNNSTRLPAGSLSFTAEFFTEFIPSAGSGREGYDISVDNDEPIGADRIKGLMRAAALETLGLRPELVDDIFGTQSDPSPWHWIAFDEDSEWRVGNDPFGSRSRIQIDAEHHSAKKGAIAFAETAWTPTWRFEIRERICLVEKLRDLHVLVLTASALSVKHLGLWRRRGYGWVGISHEAGPLKAEQIQRLMKEQVV